MQIGVKFDIISHYIKLFTGMGRRFEYVGTFNNIKVFDDYAHHPTEIKAALDGARSYKRIGKRVVTIFQPHRYTRLKALWEDFLTSFKKTDLLVIVDVYSAGDEYDAEYNSQQLAEKVVQKNAVYCKGTIEECAKKILPLLKEDDIVVTMGAGDITNMGNYLIELYSRQ